MMKEEDLVQVQRDQQRCQRHLSICVGYRKVMDTLVRLVRRSLCNAFRDELGTHLLVKTTAVMGRKCGNGRCARSNSPEQTVSSRRRGRRAMRA